MEMWVLEILVGLNCSNKDSGSFAIRKSSTTQQRAGRVSLSANIEQFKDTHTANRLAYLKHTSKPQVLSFKEGF